MRNRCLPLFCLLIAATSAGCNEDADDGGSAIDQALLAEYRAALPGTEMLAAPSLSPGGAGGGLLEQALVGDPATFPAMARPIVEGVNGAVGGIVNVLETLEQHDPTVFNSETREFLWGPWENEDGFGWMSAVMRDTGPDGGEDFRYHYALVRGVDRDLASAQPVIWGGANPDPTNPDFGSGVTLWDFEANAAFEQANNATPPALDRGRFVSVYGRGPDENNPSNTVTMVIAAFRGFVPKDRPDATPGDLDYLYGEVASAEQTVRFVDFAGTIDIDDGDNDPATQTPSAAENLSVRLVVLADGVGRAEVMASGGDLEANPDVDALVAVECWNAAFARSYLSFTALGPDGGVVFSSAEGAETDCAAPFQASLAELGIPALSDVPADLSAALDQVATTGVPAE